MQLYKAKKITGIKGDTRKESFQNNYELSAPIFLIYIEIIETAIYLNVYFYLLLTMECRLTATYKIETS